MLLRAMSKCCALVWLNSLHAHMYMEGSCFLHNSNYCDHIFLTASFRCLISWLLKSAILRFDLNRVLILKVRIMTMGSSGLIG
jgi:hypothetical protein